MKIRPSALLPLLLVGCVSAFAQSLSAPLDKVVAVVDETVILQSELDRAINNILSQYAGRTDQMPPRDVLEKQVLDRIILIRVQAQRAQDTGIRINEGEIDAAIANVAQQNNLPIEQLRASLERDGFSYSEFRETMRDELLLQRMRQRFAQTQVSVSDSEIENLLSSDQLGGEVHLGHILIAVPDGADADTVALGQTKADGVRKLISEGMEFNAAAIRYSDAPNALDGGDLGWRTVSEIPSAFVELVGSLQPGDVTPAVRGPAGFHILKLHEKRAEAQRVIEEFHARHIMIPINELTTSEQAEAITRELHTRILAGEDFATLAREHSKDHNTAPLGGDLGWFPADGYGTAVSNVVTSLTDGGLSEPFQTDLGWHVLQRLETRQQDRTTEFLRAQAAEAIRSRKAEEEYDRYLRQLRDEAYIENRLASTPSADSNN
jgi:peptidyl-prolyl cis-trans isomerase SurA